MSRSIIDACSALIFRWVLLLIFERSKFPGKRLPWHINKEYRKTLNKAYENKDRYLEIEKRRERGRIIRTAFVPAFLILLKYKSWPDALPLALVGVTLIYAYSEVSLFKEAKLIEQA